MASLTPEDVAARRQAFRQLHEAGCFVIPNPWDRGSARWLEHVGFKALATTSSGFAWSRSVPDAGGVGLQAVLQHAADLVDASGLPLNVDFRNGHAESPDAVAVNVARCAATGVAGLSVEDSTGAAGPPLYELSLARERIAAARGALDAAAPDVLLTARAECFLVGVADPLGESVRRLQAYAEAGADVLFAPGVRTREQMAELVAAVAPRPVNVLISWSGGPDVAEMAVLGVRRISVGSGLARAAWAGFQRAAGLLAEGSFAGFEGITPGTDLEAFFTPFAGKRS